MFLAPAADRLYSETCPGIPSKDLQKSTGRRNTMSAISRRHFIGTAAAASAIPLIGSSAHAQADWPTTYKEESPVWLEAVTSLGLAPS
jgi:hypothetical protein